MQVVKSLKSKYDGENLTGNGVVINHLGERFIYQHFDLGMRLTAEGGWQIAYGASPLVVWRFEGRHPACVDVRRDPTAAEIEIAAMAHSGALDALVARQASDEIIDPSPWQKGDDQVG